MVLIAVAFWKGWVVPEETHKQVVVDRDYWKTIALKGINAGEELNAISKEMVGKLEGLAAQTKAQTDILSAMEKERETQRQRAEWDAQRDRESGTRDLRKKPTGNNNE